METFQFPPKSWLRIKYETFIIDNVFKRLYKCATYLNTLPFMYDNSTGRIVHLHGNFQWIKFWISLIVQIVAWLIVVKWYIVRFNGSGFDAPLWQQVMLCYYFLVFFILFVALILAFTRREELVTLFNKTFQLEEKCKEFGTFLNLKEEGL